MKRRVLWADTFTNGRLVAAVVLASFAIASSPAAAQTTAPEASQLQSALNARVASVPGTGIVVGIVDRGRESVYFAGTAGNARPLDAHTLFEIGSVTKTFTATALASMVLAGQVKLDAPVATLLPKNVHVPSAPGDPITLLNLAEQRSGLPRMPTNMTREDDDDPFALYTRADMFAFLSGYTLPRSPGSDYEYSNYGAGLLGQALAEKAGSSYETLIATRVLTPLGMTETTFASMPPASPPAFAVGHDLNGSALGAWHFASMMPAGGVRSDLTDMLKYLRCNMGQGPLAATCLFAQKPRADGPPGHRIGLFWETNAATGAVSHGGDTAGFHSFVAISRDHQTGVVVMSNGPVVADIAAHVIDPSYPIGACPTSVAANLVDPASYAGIYCNTSSGLVFTVAPPSSADALQIALVPQPAAEYKHTTGDSYANTSLGAVATFVRQGDRIVGLRFTQGQDVDLLRLDAAGKPFVAQLPTRFSPIVALDLATLQQYAGSYDAGSIAFTVTVRGEQLYVQLTGQSAYPVFASAKDRFFYKVVDAQIDFNRDAAGNVTSLTLHQNGRDIVAKRATPI